jgi:hypothetical protein
MVKMRERLAWALLAALGLAVVASLTGVVRGGPLDPPGAPAPTLPQVEPRTPIRQPAAFPIVLNQPGSYFLTQDITGVAGKDGIEIAADNVTIDLNGFVLLGVAGSGSGIITPSPQDTIVVRNGEVRGWTGSGIDLYASVNERLSQLVIDYNGDALSVVPNIKIGNHSSLTDCTATFSPARGVEINSYSLVENCVVNYNGREGIAAFGSNDRIMDNHVVGNGAAGASSGIWLDGLEGVAVGNTVEDNACCGIFASGTGGSVHGNTGRNNNGGGGNNFLVSPPCTGCDIGPSESAAAGTHPGANYSD